MKAKNQNPTWLAWVIVAGGGLLAAVLGLASYVNSVPPLHPDPQQVPSVAGGVTPPRWTLAADQARQIARAGVSGQNLPGLSVAVGVGADLVWTEGFGWADIENRVPVSPSLRFRIGHASKALTSAAVGVLRDQGRLHLDDEIQTYVPAFPAKPWPVTLRQLMGHLAGVRHYRGQEADRPSGHCERASEGLQSFADDALLFEPGTAYGYSTYGWVLVSAAVESVAGEPFFSFMRTQVFAPLGMTDTRPDSATEAIPNRATPYFPRFSGDNAFGQDVAPAVDYSCFAGAGAFLSTPADLVRFGMAINNGRFLQPATVRLLQTPQVLASGEETAYGLGWMLDTVQLSDRGRAEARPADGPDSGSPKAGPADRTPGTRLASHASRSLVASSTSFLTFPDRGLVVAVTSNTSYADTRSIALGIAQVFAEHSR